jgi:hypothetical protein
MFIIHTTDLDIVIIGIEIKCGMIGFGVTHFSNLIICGQLGDMIDGDLIITVTTIMVGMDITTGITDLGIIKVITQYGIVVEKMYPIM